MQAMAADEGKRPVARLRGSDVGARLREAREKRGLTIQAISHATKIPPGALDAIEHNDVARLPRGPYTRGHVRAYAAEVGLNPNEVAAEYLAQFNASDAEPPAPAPPEPVVDRPANSALPVAVVVLLCGIGVLAYRAIVQPSVDTQQSVPDVPSESSARPSPNPLSPDQVTSTQDPAAPIPPQAAAPGNRPLRLEMVPDKDCWVSVRADGQLVVFRVMRPGEREVIEADDSLVVSVGNAGAFVYRINGVEGRPLGGPGAVVTVRITEDSYRTFFADASKPVAQAPQPAAGVV